jgi:hypothetical protein
MPTRNHESHTHLGHRQEDHEAMLTIQFLFGSILYRAKVYVYPFPDITNDALL